MNIYAIISQLQPLHIFMLLVIAACLLIWFFEWLGERK